MRTKPYSALVVGVSDRRTHKELAPMSSRPLAALASVVLAVLGIVFLLPPDCASACTCGSAYSQGQKEIVESELSSSEAVFVGKVVDFGKSTSSSREMTIIGGASTATLRVSEVWKGPERETLEVSTSSQEGACGYPFEEGREYLVYAYGGQGLETDSCSQTKPLSEAGADLAVLGNSEKPKDGSNDEALSDTSGGVSARAIAGMAGLLMAASLLVVARLVRTG
jgi:hypothetical protein